MIVVLSAGLVVVACVAVLNLALTLAIVKRLRGIEERLDGTGGGGDTLPAIGTEVRGFQLTTMDGESLDDTEFSGGTRQVFVLSPDCGPCKELSGKLIADPGRAEPGAIVMIVGSGDDEGARELAESLPDGLRIGFDTAEAHQDALSVGAYPAVLTIVDGKVTTAAHSLPKRSRALSGA